MGNYKGAEQEQENRDNGDEDEEALSLCDLPNKSENQFKKESPARGSARYGAAGAGEEEFDFCSWGGSMKESEMCAADDVFFQGQILPLRHSVSSDGASAGIRCNSMDRCHSVGGYTTASSRSSSTRSHVSSSSSAASTSKPRRIRNQFQYSQPSPTPQLRFSKVSHGQPARNSTLWSLFRVGLVTMPEIGSRSFRIRNRDNDNDNNNRNKTNITQKLKQRFTDKNLIFFDTCKCSLNSVETIIPSRTAKGQDEKIKINKKEEVSAGKQAMSRIRTFEWIKQLSLEGENATTNE